MFPAVNWGVKVKVHEVASAPDANVPLSVWSGSTEPARLASISPGPMLPGTPATVGGAAVNSPTSAIGPAPVAIEVVKPVPAKAKFPAYVVVVLLTTQVLTV